MKKILIALLTSASPHREVGPKHEGPFLSGKGIGTSHDEAL
jgi:hypothetical protein